MAPVHARGHDEGVEGVDAAAAIPAGAESLGEAREQRIEIAYGGLGQGHAEVQDARWRPVGAVDLVGVFVDHVHPEALQDRQHLGQRHRFADPHDGEPQFTRIADHGCVELEVQLGGFELLDREGVIDAGGWFEVLFVGLGEGVVVDLQECNGLRLPHAIDQQARVLIGPGAGGGRDAFLEVYFVISRDALARGNVHHEVQSSKDRFGDPCGELDRYAAEGLAQDGFDLQPHRGGVAIARQVHQAGQEPAVVIGAHVQPCLPALLKVHDRFGELREESVVDLEELIARVGLQELE